MNLTLSRLNAVIFAGVMFGLGVGRSQLGLTQDLAPLPYNHPGLVVDLGVGLWAWPVPVDADADGDYDLMVSCPDQPSNGVYLFENPGSDGKTEKFPIFKASKRLSKTVHYVMPSYTAAGLRVLTPGFEYPDFVTKGLESRKKLPLETNFYRPVGNQPKGPKVRHHQWRYCDFDGDERLDIVVGIEDWSDYGWDDAWNKAGIWTNGPLHGFVFWFRNQGSNEAPVYDAPEQVRGGDQPIDVYGCPSPNFEDFDGDGDLDLLCGEFLDGFTYFENIGSRKKPVYASGRRLQTEQGKPLTMDLQMIVPIAFDWDRDGDFDLIVGDEDGRVALVENLGQLDHHRVPVFSPPVYFQQQADALKCGALATPVGYDWDGDGDEDLLAGNTAGYIEFFENLSGPGVEHPKWNAPVRLTAGDQIYRLQAGPNGSIQGPAEAKWGYTSIAVTDWDHDGLPDILVNGIWGRVHWLKNVGSRQKPLLSAPEWICVQWEQTVPKPKWTWWEPEANQLVTQWRTTPCPLDWNRDGLTDLVMLDHEGYLSVYMRVRTAAGLQLLPPQRWFAGQNVSVTDSKHVVKSTAPGTLRLNDGSAGASGRRKLCFVDWNGDGGLDLLVNSTNANLLESSSRKADLWTFQDRGPLTNRNIQGHTTSPAIVDFNADGVPDFIGGAEDGRFYYLRNPRNP